MAEVPVVIATMDQFALRLEPGQRFLCVQRPTRYRTASAIGVQSRTHPASPHWIVTPVGAVGGTSPERSIVSVA